MPILADFLSEQIFACEGESSAQSRINFALYNFLYKSYGWTITSPADGLLDFILQNGLTDILLNRNEASGFQITGTGTHSGNTNGAPPKPSSTRKYVCPCCGMSVRATKEVRIMCMDCGKQMEVVTWGR